MVEAADLARERRADLLQRLAGCFARRKMAAQAGRYIDGLTADLPPQERVDPGRTRR